MNALRRNSFNLSEFSLPLVSNLNRLLSTHAMK